MDVQTISVGGRPLHMTGTIDDPGPDAVVKLDITAESVPIDKSLLDALKPDVRKVVDQFNPSGTVRAHAKVSRVPMAGRPEGKIAIDAEIDLSERCEITWAKLPYTIRNLTGRLELHPDRWVFRDMRGQNGQAVVTASGVGDTSSRAQAAQRRGPAAGPRRAGRPGSSRSARSSAWPCPASGRTPGGRSIRRGPATSRRPCTSNRTARIGPTSRSCRSPESTVKLLVVAVAAAEAPGSRRADRAAHGRRPRPVRLRQRRGGHERRGRPVPRRPVRFDHGTVVVKHTGQFDLSVTDLWVKELRLDSELRKKMPPLMAQFAQKLDDGRTFTARGDLKIGWSGVANEPAWCRWDRMRVVLNDNKLQTGIPLEHIQGELERVSGWSNGLGVKVEGIMTLESVVLLGQQITKVESPFRVQDGRGRAAGPARDVPRRRALGPGMGHAGCHAQLLGDDVLAWGPARGIRADARRRRSYRGNIDARIECSGLGSDSRTLQGLGEAHISDGDLGELPSFFRLFALREPDAELFRRPPGADQDGVRLGRPGVHDLARAVEPGSDQVHRQRLQPRGPWHARPADLPGPPARRRCWAATASTSRSSAT